jgi:hypothetical protein
VLRLHHASLQSILRRVGILLLLEDRLLDIGLLNKLLLRNVRLLSGTSLPRCQELSGSNGASPHCVATICADEGENKQSNRIGKDYVQSFSFRK